jgi:hypothetical protein
MGWLATLFGGVYYATSGPKKPVAAAAAPPLNASSSDEADFIKCANSPFPSAGAATNLRTTGSSWRSRTRSTKRLECVWDGLYEAVYIYPSRRCGCILGRFSIRLNTIDVYHLTAVRIGRFSGIMRAYCCRIWAFSGFASRVIKCPMPDELMYADEQFLLAPNPCN